MDAKFVRNLSANDPNFADEFDPSVPKVVVSDHAGKKLWPMTLAAYQADVEAKEHAPASGYIPPDAVVIDLDEVEEVLAEAKKKYAPKVQGFAGLDLSGDFCAIWPKLRKVIATKVGSSWEGQIALYVLDRLIIPKICKTPHVEPEAVQKAA